MIEAIKDIIKKRKELSNLTKKETDKNALRIRVIHEISTFLKWFYENTEGKDDSEINYLDFGVEFYNQYWQIMNKYPELGELLEIKYFDPEEMPGEKIYYWLDYDGFSHKYTYEEMKRSYLTIKDRLGKYSLEEIGPSGSYKEHISVAYLSYAYYEKWLMKYRIKEFENFINS